MIATFKNLKNNSRKYSDWDFLVPVFSGSTPAQLDASMHQILLHELALVN